LADHRPSSSRSRPANVLSGWPLWEMPAGFLTFFTAVVGAALSLAAVLAATTSVRLSDLGLWLGLLGGGAVCIELTRHGSQPAGVSRDLLSAWKIPIALLLPPLFAVITALPFTALKQVRVRPGAPHRRVLSAAAIGISDGIGSLLFHLLVPPFLSPASWLLVQPTRAVAAAALGARVAPGILQAVINNAGDCDVSATCPA